MFAALNSVEPPVESLAEIDPFHADEAWAEERRPAVVETVKRRPEVPSERLYGRAYRALDTHVRRCEARPAFQKALADQMAPFAACGSRTTAGCEGCSMLVDQVGQLAHLHARDTSFVLVSRAAIAVLEVYRKRM